VRERLNGKRNGKADSQQLEPTETELRKSADDLLLAVSVQDRGRKVQGGQVGVGFKPKNLLLLWSGHQPEIGVCFLVTASLVLGASVCGRSVAGCPHLAVVAPLPSLAIVSHAVRTVSGSDATPADGPRSAIAGSLAALGSGRQSARGPASCALMSAAAATTDVSAATGSTAATAVVSSSALATTALGMFSARLGAITGEMSLFSAVVTRALGSSAVLNWSV
jgi:hypothetical protein